MSVEIRIGEERLIKLAGLPEAKLVNRDWHVRGALCEDDDLAGILKSIENLLAIYVKKEGQEEKVERVAKYLSDNRSELAWDDRTKSFGYAYWTSMARNVIDLVNE